MADTPAHDEQQPTVAQPGTTITPAGAPRPEEMRTTTLETPTAQVEPAPQPAPAPPPELPKQPDPAPSAPQKHAPAPQVQTHPVADTKDGGITWTASEFIAHEKSASWYLTVALAGALVASIVFLLTKDFISATVIIVCTITFGFYGARQPRQLRYAVNDHGIAIGEKFFPYDQFRCFSVAHEGVFSNIVFMPLKRFATMASIYYAPEDETAIVDILIDKLPLEDHSPDPVDRLMRRIRF